MKAVLAAITMNVMLVVMSGIASSKAARADNPCSTGTTAKFDGACWNARNTNEKLSIVQGIWAGGDARIAAVSLIGDEPSYLFSKDFMALPSMTTLGDISAYFDVLYKIPANREIPWKWAYILATMNARDDDSNDRVALVKFLREYKELPTYGKYLGAITPDSIKVEANGHVFEVRLAGVTAKGMTDTDRRRAVAYLNAFKRVSWWSCDRAEDASVFLTYGDIFASDGRLQATALISGNNVCINGQIFGFSDISGINMNRLNLSYLLTAYGISYSEEYVDPKWSDNDRQMFSFSVVSGNAINKKLYLHGGNKDLTVEAILAQSAGL